MQNSKKLLNSKITIENCNDEYQRYWIEMQQFLSTSIPVFQSFLQGIIPKFSISPFYNRNFIKVV